MSAVATKRTFSGMASGQGGVDVFNLCILNMPGTSGSALKVVVKRAKCAVLSV